MLRLTSTNRIVLEIATALALTLLAVACVAAIRGWRPRGRRDSPQVSDPTPVVICLLCGWLALAFAIPSRSSNPQIDSRIALLMLARSARSGVWAGQSLRSVIEHAREVRGLDDLGELLAVETRAAPQAHLADGMFSGGARLAADRPPLATFEGWSTHDLGTGHCEIIVYFRPSTTVSGSDLWLHEYPDHSPDYVDIGMSLPPREWMRGDLAWEVFHSAHAGEFTVYAGIRSGAALGPGVLLGHVDRCAA
jgi:hypothetical protein